MRVLEMLRQWWVARRGTKLHQQFSTERRGDALMALMDLATQRGVPLRMSDRAFVQALKATLPWTFLDDQRRGTLFEELEKYLFANVRDTGPDHWEAWVMAADVLRSPIDISSPATTRPLAEAGRLGKFSQLTPKARAVLLGLFQRAHCQALDAIEDPSGEYASALLNDLTALAQAASTAETDRALSNWSSQFQVRPRPLTGLTHEQAFRAPLRGVGSPNGASVTLFCNPGDPRPARIAFAGSTGDPTLNAQILQALFAAALACDSEPTFLTTNGGTLSLDSGGSSRNDAPPSRALLSAQIGLVGPVEPTRGMPVLGMSTEEALLLTTDTLRALEKKTGLVTLARWDLQLAAAVDRRVSEQLGGDSSHTSWISNDRTTSEGSAVVHAMPLLERDRAGLRPIAIDVPLAVLGGRKLFDLSGSTRRLYMCELIAGAQRRQGMAKQAASEQSTAIERWQAATDAEKGDLCRRNPTVAITGEYDFELGVVVRLRTARTLPRRDYEEDHRPAIRDQALNYEMKFGAIAKKLSGLNAEGGRADVLAVKMLVDAMIRQAAPPVPDPEFQAAFLKWTKVTGPATWNALRRWAAQRSYPFQALAGDNVVFNTRINTQRGVATLEPWALVDLHDFLVQVDPVAGTMRVFPGGTALTLEETLARDAPAGISDLRSLHEAFGTFATKSTGLRNLDDRQRQLLTEEPFSSPKMAAFVAVARAKKLLFRGDALGAQRLLAEARASDQPAVYLWGAIAHACDSLLLARLRNLLAEPSVDRLLAAFDAPPGEGTVQLAFALIASAHQEGPGKLPPDCERYLRQLHGRDATLLSRIVKDQQSFPDLEFESFEFTSQEKNELATVVAAVSAVELLALAEAIGGIARRVPFTGVLPSTIRQELENLLVRPLTFRDAPEAAQLEALKRALAGEAV